MSSLTYQYQMNVVPSCWKVRQRDVTISANLNGELLYVLMLPDLFQINDDMLVNKIRLLIADTRCTLHQHSDANKGTSQ